MKKTTLLLASTALVMGASGAFAGSHTGSITAVSWGGAYTVSQIEAYHKPWTAATGNKVVSEDYSGGIAEVKAQVEAGNVTWDIIDVEKSDAVRGCDEGLFMEIDPTSLPNGADGSSAVDDFIPGSFTDCAVANIVWSTIFAYDSVRNTKRSSLNRRLLQPRRFPLASGAFASLQKQTWKWLWLLTVLPLQTSMTFWQQTKALIAHLQNSIPSKTSLSGGKPARSHHNCWQMAKLL